MASPTKELIMSGYLEKKSPKSVLGVHAWQRRFFQLLLLSSAERGHEISMFYYKSEADISKEPLGEIVLNDIMSVAQLKEKDKENRFDIQVPSRVFALKCDNPNEIKKWIQALQSLSAMNDYQKPSHLPDSPEETMKLLAQSSGTSNPTKSNATQFSDATAAIDLITKGSAFLKYKYDYTNDTCERDIVLVFYKKDTTSLGSLYFCEPGEKTEDASTALALHTLTDMYLGKQSKAFRSPIAKNAASDRCFTALGATRNGQPAEFNLEGDSKEQVAAWLFATNALLTHVGGRKVMTAEDSAKEEAEKKRKAELAKKEAEEAAAKAAADKAARSAAFKAEKERRKSVRAAGGNPDDETVVSFVGFDSDDDPDEEDEETADVPAAAAPVAAPVAEPVAAVAAVAPVTERMASMDLSNSPVPFVQDGTETIITWLASLGDAYPAEYGRLFQSNGVDLEFLVGLNADDLSQLGIKNGLHLKKMLAGIEVLKSSGKYAAPQPSSTPVPETPVSPTSSSAPAEEQAPVDPETLTEVGKFLYKLGPAFLTYLKAFELNGVDFNFLQTLQDDDLEELGVSKLHRKKVLAEVKALRDQKQAEARAAAAAAAPPAPAAPGAPPAPAAGGYLARAQANKAAAGGATSASASKMDQILESIREAKRQRAEQGSAAPQQQSGSDGFDLDGTSIAAIAARMAAQREARAQALAQAKTEAQQ